MAKERLWDTKRDGLGTNQDQLETIVFIALEPLTPDNGFFMRLDEGQDVCLDSKASVQFPSTGGGRGVYIALKI